MTKLFRVAALLALLLAPARVLAVTYDIVIDASSIVVDPVKPRVGQLAKVYLTARSVGTLDVEGVAVFNDGDALIGRKALSIRAGGRDEEVWTTWVPTTVGTHVIRVNIANDLGYPDATPENNVAQISVVVEGNPDPPPPQPGSSQPATSTSPHPSTATTTSSATKTARKNALSASNESKRRNATMTVITPQNIARTTSTATTATMTTTPSATTTVDTDARPADTTEEHKQDEKPTAAVRKSPGGFETQNALWILAAICAVTAAYFFRQSSKS